MHKLLIICAWVFVFYSKTHAQINLVPNPSFEDTVPPPRPPGHIDFVQNWVNPTAGTPDYYHVCPPVACVPGGGGVFQYPNTGNAFIGIYAYDETNINVREYVQVQLIDTLISNNCYYASFYANVTNWVGKSCNNLGIYLSDTVISSQDFYVMEYPAQIKKFNNEIITDTLDWHRIEGIYVANGNELFLTLGNFNNDLTTDTITSNYSSIYPRAYYNIDDVSVIPIDSLPGGMPANAGADTNVILGDSVFIGQQISNLNCNWYDEIGTLIASNISGIYVSPTVSTYYVVEQNLCGVITYDTVNVTVLPVGVNELFTENEVRMYPNPTTGELSIVLSHQNSAWSITIVDLQGRTVIQQFVNSNIVTLKLALENGVYLVQITNKNTNEKVIKKLVIQH